MEENKNIEVNCATCMDFHSRLTSKNTSPRGLSTCYNLPEQSVSNNELSDNSFNMIENEDIEVDHMIYMKDSICDNLSASSNPQHSISFENMSPLDISTYNKLSELSASQNKSLSTQSTESCSDSSNYSTELKIFSENIAEEFKNLFERFERITMAGEDNDHINLNTYENKVDSTTDIQTFKNNKMRAVDLENSINCSTNLHSSYLSIRNSPEVLSNVSYVSTEEAGNEGNNRELGICLKENSDIYDGVQVHTSLQKQSTTSSQQRSSQAKSDSYESTNNAYKLPEHLSSDSYNRAEDQHFVDTIEEFGERYKQDLVEDFSKMKYSTEADLLLAQNQINALVMSHTSSPKRRRFPDSQSQMYYDTTDFRAAPTSAELGQRYYNSYPPVMDTNDFEARYPIYPVENADRYNIPQYKATYENINHVKDLGYGDYCQDFSEFEPRTRTQTVQRNPEEYFNSNYSRSHSAHMEFTENIRKSTKAAVQTMLDKFESELTEYERHFMNLKKDYCELLMQKYELEHELYIRKLCNLP